MPISKANCGSVSDRSKVAITFTIDEVQIRGQDHVGNPLDFGFGPGAPVALSSGQTMGVDNGQAISLGAVGGPGACLLFFDWVFSASQSGGSKRAADADLYCVNKGIYFSQPPTVGMTFETHAANPANPHAGTTIDGVAGEERHSIGRFDGVFHGNEYDAGIDDGQYGAINLVSGTTMSPFPQRDRFVIEGEPIDVHGLLDATGSFKVLDDQLIAGDLKTGVYAVGPDDGFTFSIKIVP